MQIGGNPRNITDTVAQPWDGLHTEDDVRVFHGVCGSPVCWDRKKGLEKRNTFVFTQPELRESSLSEYWFVCTHASTAANLEHSPFQESPGEQPTVDSPARHGDTAAKMPRGPCRRIGRADPWWGTHMALWGASKGQAFFPECFKFQRLKTTRWACPLPLLLCSSALEVSAGDCLPLHFHLGGRQYSKKAPMIFCPHSCPGVHSPSGLRM
ncbi:uncharacterized protein LOC113594629 [Acinonyx jubatus]|uniref:Uncharacterized protein LOC113594629 n=1 Tax=Acinonyx jubatus TaxID=32536 RepID=A0ABM3PTN6_ACIJB|nr:uncharacterized protein LOC113594629 [Acinonyx jubatus]